MKLSRSSCQAAVILVVASTLADSTRAQDITCRKDDAFRRVQVVIENALRGLPCEVVLWSTPAEQRRVWRADFERGFCAKKLQAFVQRLTDDRWLCQPTKLPPSERQSIGRSPVM